MPTVEMLMDKSRERFYQEVEHDGAQFIVRDLFAAADVFHLTPDSSKFQGAFYLTYEVLRTADIDLRSSGGSAKWCGVNHSTSQQAPFYTNERLDLSKAGTHTLHMQIFRSKLTKGAFSFDGKGHQLHQAGDEWIRAISKNTTYYGLPRLAELGGAINYDTFFTIANLEQYTIQFADISTNWRKRGYVGVTLTLTDADGETYELPGAEVTALVEDRSGAVATVKVNSRKGYYNRGERYYAEGRRSFGYKFCGTFPDSMEPVGLEVKATVWVMGPDGMLRKEEISKTLAKQKHKSVSFGKWSNEYYNIYRKPNGWYRGNTHTHTEFCGHADSRPEAVAAWYHERGYNFLVLSEHDHFIDPAKVLMPENLRKDFILIPGEELSSGVGSANAGIHVTSMNAPRHVETRQDHPAGKQKHLQFLVDQTRKAGGEPILNHPNHSWTIVPQDVMDAKHLYLFELFNAEPNTRNFGRGNIKFSVENRWDIVLSKGKPVYGVASDDAHIFKESVPAYFAEGWREKGIAPAASNPGRGWVMVRSDRLTPDAIVKAMKQGHFYASNGVMLKVCRKTSESYDVEIDEDWTRREMANPWMRGRIVTEGTPGFRIEFICKGGKVLASFDKSEASFTVTKDQPYVRAKATYTEALPDGTLLQAYAWGQPVFTDGRATASTK